MRLSPRAYRRITLVALGLLSAIIVTGGGVRVTGSGLGCPEWPTCTDGALAPEVFEESSAHATIEFLNRAVTGLVSLAVIVAVLGALLRRPRRRDLTWLSVSLVLGIVGQIVLGGITVLTDLHPAAVQSHFLLSLVIVLAAVSLHRRAGLPDGPPDEAAGRAATPPRRLPLVDAAVARASRVAVAVLVPTIVAGTVLTGTGPHGGDPEAQRFSFHPPTVARVHGVLVELFTAALLVTLVLAWRRRAPRPVLVRGSVALGVAIAQSVLGYTQYFTGVPALLVGIHIVGATALWIAVLRFHLGLWGPDEVAAPPVAAVGGERRAGRLASSPVPAR